jgi:hypothetical protein
LDRYCQRKLVVRRVPQPEQQRHQPVLRQQALRRRRMKPSSEPQQKEAEAAKSTPRSTITY